MKPVSAPIHNSRPRSRFPRWSLPLAVVLAALLSSTPSPVHAADPTINTTLTPTFPISTLQDVP